MASPETQRDLLLGHLALELNFINAETFEAAKKVWNFDKSRPMGLILVERQAISPHTRDVLENLVQLQVVQDASEPDPTPPVNADATDMGDIELLVPPERETQTVVSVPTQRFRKLKPHAAGALGQVYLARDKELHRKVALKEIKELYADNPDARSRFLLEAEITGRLEHPGVVPVYGLGTYASGRPYYAMRFIKGESLEEAVKHLHAPDSTRSAADRAMELRRLLTKFISVCNTMQYAHDRDIVHRDLKPSNIMLGAYGETLVVDWGLAKVMGKITADPSGSIFEPLLSSGSSSDTLPGRAIGTITYMSPEQAAGRVDQIGPVSDVYCLGATMFSLLTGRPSVEDSMATDPKRADLRKLQTKVVSGEILRPRQVKPDLDRALEAICMKCMQRQPEHRYPSARAIADDLERWLANEPVEAYPEPITVKTRRWVSRHRTLVTAGAAALVVGFVFFMAQTAMLTTTNIELDYQKNQAMALKHEAEMATKEAKKANEGLVEQTEIATQLMNKEKIASVEATKQKTAAEIASAEAKKQERLAVAAAERAKTQQLLAENSSALNTTMLAQSRWNEGQVILANEILEQVRPQNRHGGWDFLRRQFEGSYATLYGHVDSVRAVAHSVDGKLLASLGKDGTLKTWDPYTGKNFATITGVTAFAISPDSLYVATGGKDGKVKRFDARTGVAQIASPKLHDETITSLAFSPDGKRLASASQDGKIKWSDPATLKDATELKKKHIFGVTGLAFSPDGKRLASTGLDKTLFVWDIETGEPAQTYLSSTNGVAGVTFSPDGKYFASVGMAKLATNEPIKVWKADTGEELPSFKGRHPRGITAVQFSPDGQRLASAGWDGTVVVWNALTGKELATLQGHGREVLGVSFSPDGQRLASAGGDCTVKLWELQSGQEIQTFAGQLKAIASVAFHPDDSKRLASGGWNGSVKVWNVNTGTAVWEVAKAHATEVLSVAFSPDGQHVASAGQDGKVKLWDATNGKELPVKIKGHADAVTSLAFNRDGTRLASASKDKTVVIWDALTGLEVKSLKPTAKEESSDITSVSFSPDGQRLAWADRNGMLKIWETGPGKEFLAVQGHSDGITSVAYSPDGKFFASAGQDGKVAMWESGSGQLLVVCKGHGAGVMGVSFSRDGNRLASASKDGTVKLWDSNTGQELKTFHGHGDLVTSVAFSPDGTRVASASLDKTLKLWSVATGTVLPIFKGQHTKAVVAVTFSTDGKTLYSRDESGKVAVWNAETGTEVKEVKAADFGATRASLSPDGKKVAIPFASWFYVVDLGVAKNEADYRVSMSTLKPWWQEEQAVQFEKEKKMYAAAFHWAQLVHADPKVQKNRDRFDAACSTLTAWEVESLRRQAGLSVKK